MFSKPKRIIATFIFFLLSLLMVLITVKAVDQKASYESRANGSQVITPITIPGSMLDTGIKAESFIDVDHNSWSWKYIQQIAPLNIIVPPQATPTEFNPQGLVLRSDMAQFLLKTYKLITNQDPPLVETPFTDIQTLPQEIQEAIAKIYGLKLTAGTSATTFSPDDPVTRAQMVTFFMSFYHLLSGNFPPENKVPFTNIYDPDLEWSVKYIKMAYDLKITAGTSETTFSPRNNVTREQMCAFIFSFMRLFGSSWNNPGLSQELANLHSVTYYPSPASVEELNQWLEEIKQTGFNALWFVNGWKDFNPRPLANPPIYNDTAFNKLTQILDLLRQNNMKAILPLNYIGPAPEGIDVCRWTVDLPMYQAFETYVQEFLKRIEGYSDIVYILFFTEGAEPCGLNAYGESNAKQIASILRPTLGSLPQRLDPQLRSKFKFGYHDYTLINHNWAGGESPIQMPLSYDFLSGNAYEFEAKTDQEIIDGLNSRINNFKKIYPFTRFLMGEFGALPCNDPNNSQNSSTRDNQARILKTGIQHLLSRDLGFNAWQWQGEHYHSGDTCSTMTTAPAVSPNALGIIFRDYTNKPLVSKPARLEIMKLLNPSVPLPQCLEQDTPVFAQNIVDEHYKYCHQFSSTCIPEGWSIIEGITDCSQACTGELVWLRNPGLADGECSVEINPVHSDCLPTSSGIPKESQFTIDDTCRPQTTPPTTSPSPTVEPIMTTTPTLQEIIPTAILTPTSTPEITIEPTAEPTAEPTVMETPTSPVITPFIMPETITVIGNTPNPIKIFFTSVLDYIANMFSP